VQHTGAYTHVQDQSCFHIEDRTKGNQCINQSLFHSFNAHTPWYGGPHPQPLHAARRSVCGALARTTRARCSGRRRQEQGQGASSLLGSRCERLRTELGFGCAFPWACGHAWGQARFTSDGRGALARADLVEQDPSKTPRRNKVQPRGGRGGRGGQQRPKPSTAGASACELGFRFGDAM
jgi:hypothetical protein